MQELTLDQVADVVGGQGPSSFDNLGIRNPRRIIELIEKIGSIGGGITIIKDILGSGHSNDGPGSVWSNRTCDGNSDCVGRGSPGDGTVPGDATAGP